MLPDGLLTSDDLDEIGVAALLSDDPLAVAAELAEAAKLGRLADRAQAGYAFGLAAEIIERQGDVEAARR